MAKLKGLEKVEQAIHEGQLGVARDVLNAMIHGHPCEVSLRARLGDVYHMLGYPIDAGRCWYLVEDPSPEQLEAIEAFEKSCGHAPGVILRKLKIKCYLEDLSTQAAQDKVTEVLETGPVHLNPKEFIGPYSRQPRLKSSDGFSLLGCIIALIILALVVIGVISVVGWIQH